MKVYPLLSAALCGSLLLCSSNPVFAKPEPSDVKSPFTMLQQMDNAGDKLNYQLSYINITQQGIESLRYRHVVIDGKVYAQLLQMDGPQREVVQRNNAISYFDATSGVDAFTLPGEHIIDGLPPVLFANIDKLKNDYDFIAVGRSRVADHLCDVVRIVSKDGSRYSYAIWLDTQTSLPLRADLLTQNGDMIEQFQVIDFSVDNQLKQAMTPLITAELPPVMSSLPQNSQTVLDWQPGWLPAGVVALSQSKRHIPALNKSVESRLYSDGLFTFTVNITPASASSVAQSFSTGRRTIFIEVRNNREISVVGELPHSTAKRIADSVKVGN